MTPDDDDRPTVFYLMITKAEQIEGLIVGRVDDEIKDMARAMSAWGLVELLQRNRHKPALKRARKGKAA